MNAHERREFLVANSGALFLGDVVSMQDVGGSAFFPFVAATDLAIDVTASTLYVADQGDSVIYKIVLNSDSTNLQVVSIAVLAGTKQKFEIKVHFIIP